MAILSERGEKYFMLCERGSTYAERQVSAETHASCANLSCAVGAAHQVVDHHRRILIVSVQLLFDLVPIALVCNTEE